MPQAGNFGARLRELRRKARLTQRELAALVSVDFSYLSKIENGVLPPPSEKVILGLAEALRADKDELLVLAGRIPEDIAEILRSKKALKLLRTQQKRMVESREGGLMKTFKELISTRSLGNFARVAIAVTLVFAIGVSLWYASPTKALQVTITPPSPGNLGTTHNFTVTVTIENLELIPFAEIEMRIYKSDNLTYTATLDNLPLDTGSAVYTSAQTGGGAATVSATAGTGWSYTSGTGYFVWEGTGYSFGAVSGYAYALPGSVSITYNVAWTSPGTWPAGNYKIDTRLIMSDARVFTKSSSTFSLSTPAAPAVAVPPPVTTTTNVANVVTSTGQFTQTVTTQSGDAVVGLTINQGTVGQTQAGQPLSQITITKIVTPPTPAPGVNIVNQAGAPLAPAANTTVVGLPYDFGPDGATFNPPVTITFNYNPGLLPSGVSEENLVVVFWDSGRGTWVTVDSFTVDPATNTITARVSHFTQFTVLAFTRPAAFATSDLTVAPAEVNIGEKVTITVIVKNSGDLSGSYKVTLKVNNVSIETKDVTVAGQSSQKVTFTTSQRAAGTYNVAIDSLTGKFTVKAPPVPAPPVPAPPVPAPPVPAPPVPAPPVPAPPVPAPAPVPLPPPAPAPAPVNWALIAIIAVATIVVVGAVVWWLSFRRRY